VTPTRKLFTVMHSSDAHVALRSLRCGSDKKNRKYPPTVVQVGHRLTAVGNNIEQYSYYFRTRRAYRSQLLVKTTNYNYNHSSW